MGDLIALWTSYATILLGVFGVIAFGWKVFDFIVSRKGIMVPRLECHTEYSNNNNKCYIVVNTSLDNSGRKSINPNVAYLLLVYPSTVDHDDGLKKIYKIVFGKELEREVDHDDGLKKIYK